MFFKQLNYRVAQRKFLYSRFTCYKSQTVTSRDKQGYIVNHQIIKIRCVVYMFYVFRAEQCRLMININ